MKQDTYKPHMRLFFEIIFGIVLGCVVGAAIAGLGIWALALWIDSL